MIYTVHTIIFHMQKQLKVGDLDTCLTEILDVCFSSAITFFFQLTIQDQFEDTSDEKEVGSIKAEVPEAKGNKTPETLLLLGKFISATAVGKILESLREVLDKKTSSKTVSRVGILLSKFANGIKDNNGQNYADNK